MTKPAYPVSRYQRRLLQVVADQLPVPDPVRAPSRHERPVAPVTARALEETLPAILGRAHEGGKAVTLTITLTSRLDPGYKDCTTVYTGHLLVDDIETPVTIAVDEPLLDRLRTTITLQEGVV